MLLERTSERIALHANTYALGNHIAPIHAPYHLVEPALIYIAESARIHPGVVLDASDGPIVIDDDAVIMANSVILGPAYIGRSTQIKVGAKIYHGTSVGPYCKIGGEVEASIIQGYSNKQHDGFLGHAFIGEWCNLGADTNNSDLKNNYHAVKVWFGDAWQDTGAQFVGVFMGDHSKTGISTSINTGSVIGVGCNIFGGGLPPKFVPSFSWANGPDITTHRIGEALDTAIRAMARRSVTLGTAETALLRRIFDETVGERTTKSR
jgi:UDP-N-acetylglucosamine diphosphorylase/glucosamine-1-phosphate N-acetyltransferase